MNTCEGLSLTEVLVSLVIVTSTSIAILQQQWQMSRYTHQIDHRNEAVHQLDNASEQFVAQQTPVVDASYHLITRPAKSEHRDVTTIELELAWGDDTESHHLKRLLVRS